MLHLELSARVAREQYCDNLAKAARSRLAAAARQGRLTLPRRAARPLGRVLLWIGAELLRYGRVETTPATRMYRPSARSIELN